MNNYRLALVALLILVLFSVLSGCSKDDNPTEPNSDMTLVGNLKLSLMSSEYQGEIDTYTESQLDAVGFVWTLEIEYDGAVEQITNISGTLIVMPGTWSRSADQLTLILTGPFGESSTLVYEYAIDGNILKLDWNIPAGVNFYAEFTKQ